MEKTVQVIILPTNQIPQIGDIFIAMRYFIRDSKEWEDIDKWGQHLYFTSNEEIKEGDWYIKDGKSLFKSQIKHQAKINRLSVKFDEVKVVATTDKSLNLPLIPQSFIEEYLKSNGEIKEVDVEILMYVDKDTTQEPVYLSDFKELVVIHKKQTLEEAARQYATKFYDERFETQSFNELITSFTEGVKWKERNT